MKCPKCGYLGFEPVARCRNCGYDFSLTSSPSLPELPIRPSSVDPGEPLRDLVLADHRSASPSLPLFEPGAADDMPLVAAPAPARPPLAVRRATPEVPRLRTDPRPVPLDLPLAAFDPPSAVVASVPLSTVRTAGSSEAQTAVESGVHAAGATSRVLAAAVDLVLLAAVDLAVVYFTMQIGGIGLAEIGMVPKPPLVAFLAMLDIGYLVAFTTGGQTLGKMAAGIRVVSAGANRTPGLPRAFARTFLWCVLAAPAGLGFVSILLDEDHRGFHDRLAGTRVVRTAG